MEVGESGFPPTFSLYVFMWGVCASSFWTDLKVKLQAACWLTPEYSPRKEGLLCNHYNSHTTMSSNMQSVFNFPRCP